MSAHGDSSLEVELTGALYDLSNARDEAREEGFRLPSNAALQNAEVLLREMYGISARRFEVYPTPDGEIAIDAPGGPGRSVLLLCGSEGGALCLVNMSGRSIERARYSTTRSCPTASYVRHWLNWKLRVEQPTVEARPSEIHSDRLPQEAHRGRPASGRHLRRVGARKEDTRWMIRQHLTKLAIRGFRGLIEHLELDGLGAFNLQVGANDVGKTSVLEGIFLLTGSTNLELPLRVNLWRNYPVQEFDDLSYLFHDQEVDTPIQLTAHSGRARRSLSISAVYDHGPTEQPPVQGAPNGDSGRLRGSEGGADSFSSSTPSRPRALQYESTVERPQREALQFRWRAGCWGSGKFELTKQNPEMIIPARFLTPGPGYDSVHHRRGGGQEEERRTHRVPAHHQPPNRGGGGKGGYGLPGHRLGEDDAAEHVRQRYGPFGHDSLSLHSGWQRHPAARGCWSTAFTTRPWCRCWKPFSSWPPAWSSAEVFATTHSHEVLKGLRQVLREERCAGYRRGTNAYALQKDQEGLVRSYRYGYDQLDHCMAKGLEIL